MDVGYRLARRVGMVGYKRGWRLKRVYKAFRHLVDYSTTDETWWACLSFPTLVSYGTGHYKSRRQVILRTYLNIAGKLNIAGANEKASL